MFIKIQCPILKQIKKVTYIFTKEVDKNLLSHQSSEKVIRNSLFSLVLRGLLFTFTLVLFYFSTSIPCTWVIFVKQYFR